MFLDHYFKPICETAVLWTKFSLVQYFRIITNLSEFPKMGSFINIVVNIYSYMDSHVGNIQKIK